MKGKKLWSTLVESGHVALVDKHFPTRVVFSFYFESATGRKSIRLTRHLIFILKCKYQKGQKSGCFIPTGNEFP